MDFTGNFNQDYARLQELKRASPQEAYLTSFKEFAQRYFGKADATTTQQRKELSDLGFVACFSNMSHKQVLEVLAAEA